ncbi:MAG: hypothetical protein V4792_09875 [Pseudomonadota bacterium]
MTPDIRDLAAALPLNAASLEMLLSVCDRFADRLHRDGGVLGADEIVGLISDTLIAAGRITAITPEDRAAWAEDDRANARVDERWLERMA